MIDEVFEAIFGVDFKAGRTVRDIILHPIRVGEAELNPDSERYTPQIRIFIAVFGLQILLLSFFKIFDYMTLQALMAEPEHISLVEARLTELGSSVAQANGALRDWYNYSLWPSAILGSFVYIAAMKIMRPAMRLSAHIKLYLLATNAAFIWITPFFGLALIPGADPMITSVVVSLAGMVILIIYFAIIFARWYAGSALGVTLKTALLVVLVIPSMIITGLVSYSLISFGMKRETGLGLFEAFGLVIHAEIEAADAAQTQTPDP